MAKREKFKLEIIFVFSIGRSGTAYLYQVFGKKKWKPKELAYPDRRTTVVHEKWSMQQKAVEKLKLVKPTSQEGLEVQKEKLKNIFSLCKSRGTDRLFTSDSTFGRWCAYYIIQNYNYKAIFLGRNKKDLVNSWLHRYELYREKYGNKATEDLISDRWKYMYYNITDKYTLLHVDKSKWRKYSLEEKMGWYYDELIAKWNDLKQMMDKGKYLETSYEEIITVEGLTELSKFIDMPFDYDLMKKKVNTDVYQ